MIFWRMYKGETALWAALLLCLLVKIIFVVAYNFIHPQDPFTEHALQFCFVFILLFCSLSIFHCAENTDYPIFKWIARIWALLLVGLAFLKIIGLLGLIFGITLIFALTGIYLKMDNDYIA